MTGGLYVFEEVFGFILINETLAATVMSVSTTCLLETSSTLKLSPRPINLINKYIPGTRLASIELLMPSSNHACFKTDTQNYLLLLQRPATNTSRV